MAGEYNSAGWSGEDPDECTRRHDGIRADGVRSEKLEAHDIQPPFVRGICWHSD